MNASVTFDEYLENLTKTNFCFSTQFKDALLTGEKES